MKAPWAIPGDPRIHERWDVFRAELGDTLKATEYRKPLRPCVYCGVMTRALSRVCPSHEDLIELDPQAPANPEEAYE